MHAKPQGSIEDENFILHKKRCVWCLDIELGAAKTESPPGQGVFIGQDQN